MYFHSISSGNAAVSGLSYKEQKDKEVSDKIDSCVKQVRNMTDFQPEIAIVLGSGLGNFADNISVEGEIKYSDISGFPVSTAPGTKANSFTGRLKAERSSA
jgi:purine-nucleoside phosphorylase